MRSDTPNNLPALPANRTPDQAAADLGIELLHSAYWRILHWVKSQEKQWDTRKTIMGFEDDLYLQLQPEWNRAKQAFETEYSTYVSVFAIHNQDVRNILTTALKWDLIAQKQQAQRDGPERQH